LMTGALTAAGEVRLRATGRSMVTEVLASAGEVCLRATGRSMLPSLWPGDLLTIRCVAPEMIRCGDIILFRERGRLITHRVVNAGTTLVAQGDGLARPDAAIPEAEVMGRVVLVSRGNRTFEPPREMSPLVKL